MEAHANNLISIYVCKYVIKAQLPVPPQGLRVIKRAVIMSNKQRFGNMSVLSASKHTNSIVESSFNLVLLSAVIISTCKSGLLE